MKKYFEPIVRALLVDNQGRILLARREKPPEQGKWALVGGKLEMGETLEDCVRREVKEELGFDFSPTFVGYSENYKRDQADRHSIMFYFKGYAKTPLKLKADELTEARFFSLGELNQIDVAWDHKDYIFKYLK